MLALGSAPSVTTASGTIRFAGPFAGCISVSSRSTMVANSPAVSKILSDRSVGIDLVTKNAEYQAVPPVQRYVIPQQRCAAGKMFGRGGKGGSPTC